MTADARLLARDLKLGYGDRVVVDGLDLDVLDGTVTLAFEFGDPGIGCGGGHCCCLQGWMD